jgi:hypothetical protein
MIAIENCRSDQYDRILEICNSTEAKVVKLPDLVKVLEKSLQGLSENVK